MRRATTTAGAESLIFAVGVGVHALFPDWSPWTWFGIAGIAAVVLLISATKLDQRVPWRFRIERRHRAIRSPDADHELAASRARYRRANADFNRFWYDFNAGIARALTPEAYRRRPDDQKSKDSDADSPTSEEPPVTG